MPLAGIKPGDGDFMRKCCKSDIVFTDAWSPDGQEWKLPEEELLQGELSAVTFRVGCYIVRSTFRVYKSVYDAYCDREIEVPANKEDVEFIKKEGYGKSFYKSFDCSECTYMGDIISPWKENLHIVHEISAKHDMNPDNVFSCVCSAVQYMSSGCCEYIGDIYEVKRSDSTLDEFASLLVYSHCEGGLFGIDTWYKLDPSGNVTKFELSPFHIESGGV